MALDDTFINPELESQICQASTQAGPSYDCTQLRQSINSADSLILDLAQDVDASVALEAMREFIKGKKINKTSAILFNIAAETYCVTSSIKDSKPVFGLESFNDTSDILTQDELDAAMENLGEQAKNILTSLSNKLNSTMIALGDVVHGFDRNILSIKKRIASLETKVESISLKDDLVNNYVKPDNQYTHLMYSSSGFKNGLSPVFKDLNSLIVNHEKMVNSVISEYKDWYSHNKSNDSNFNTLSFNKKDFLLPDSKPFNRSIGNKKPSSGSMFYRSDELPGGLAFYTEVPNTDTSGKAVINSMMDVKWFMDYYEPNSFKIMEKRIYSAAALGVLAWASAMTVSPLPLLFYGPAAGYINDKTKTTDVKKVRISEDVVFPVLSKEELDDLISSAKETVHSLEKWNESVYKHIWKDNSVKEALAYIKSKDSEVSLKHMKNFIVALISLMTKAYTKVHSYSFDTLNAALAYGEKSTKLYR